jgi:predicted RecA/RadA family phage recombinase
MDSVDPFETTAPDSNAASPPSSALPSSSYSHASTKAGIALQVGAMLVIAYAWLVAGKIAVAWHAILGIIAVMLPTNALTDIAKGAIRAWARRGSK